jgi:hypothetical protein
MSRCNKLYICHDIDKVETWKIFISVWFTVDVAVSNIKFQIVKETLQVQRPTDRGKNKEIVKR